MLEGAVMGTDPSFAPSTLVASVVDTDIVVSMGLVWDSLKLCGSLDTWWSYSIGHFIGVRHSSRRDDDLADMVQMSVSEVLISSRDI